MGNLSKKIERESSDACRLINEERRREGWSGSREKSKKVKRQSKLKV